MLESMIHNPVPTRAEGADVANAILDGADAVMLSGETAIGSYPVESVKTMVEIAVKAESSGYFSRQFRDLSLKRKYPPHALCEAACWAAHDLGDVPIIVFTLSGDTARYLSKLRCQSSIFAFTPFTCVAGALSLSWNITPMILGAEQRMSELQARAEVCLMKEKKIRKGNIIVIVYGKMFKSGATNMLKIKSVN
jgi:pyruvate kinase